MTFTAWEDAKSNGGPEDEARHHTTGATSSSLLRNPEYINFPCKDTLFVWGKDTLWTDCRWYDEFEMTVG